MHTCVLLAILTVLPATAADPDEPGLPAVMERGVVPGFELTMGTAILVVWTVDFATRPDLRGNPFTLRERGELMWPHLLAEGATAVGLLAGGYGQARGLPWGRTASLVALGSLAYTSLSSLGWAFSEPGREPYAVAMGAGLAGASASIVILW